MTRARSRAAALLAVMQKQAAEFAEHRVRPRGIGRRALAGSAKGSLGGAALVSGLALLGGLPEVIKPVVLGSRREALKRLLANVLHGSLGGAVLGGPIGAVSEAMLGPRTEVEPRN